MSTSWTTVFEPVDATSTYEETVTRLGTAIRIGVLGPGSKLPPERELAEQLSISRSTLRQALATLTETGHLIAVRGRSGGTFVADDPPVSSGTPFPRERLRALLDWRLALELGNVQLAAERTQNGDIERLDAALEGVEAAVEADFAAYRRADAAFHLALAEIGRSPALVSATAVLQGRLCDVLAELGLPEHAREEDPGQHRAVVEALKRGDAVEAVAAMRAHLEGTERHVSGVLPDEPPGSRFARRGTARPARTGGDN
jgi:DNA-binding FadR family transcriptional regulator